MIWSLLSLVLTVICAIAGAIYGSRTKQKLKDTNAQLAADNEILKKQRDGINTIDDADKLWEDIRSKQ